MRNHFRHVILITLSLLFVPLGQAAVVNMNKANAAAMVENLQGIGPKKAAAIVSYRQSIGSFKSLDDLLNVKGIGEKTLKKNEGDMSLSEGVVESEDIPSVEKTSGGSAQITESSTE